MFDEKNRISSNVLRIHFIVKIQRSAFVIVCGFFSEVEYL